MKGRKFLFSAIMALSTISSLFIPIGTGAVVSASPGPFTISTALTFAQADALDGTTDGTLNATSLHITSTGSITQTAPNPINIVATLDMTMDGGSSINDVGSSGTYGGPINITVGNFAVTPRTGDFNMASGSTINANGFQGGPILIKVAHIASVNGLVKSIGHGTGSGTNQGHGGTIEIDAGCSLSVGDSGVVESNGADPGADLVHLQACAVVIDGLVESTTPAGHAIPSSPPNHLDSTFRPDKDSHSTAGVEIWAGNTIVIDSTGTHHGEVKADIGGAGGPNGRGWIDLFAVNNITILGDSVAPFAVHADQGGGNSQAGVVTIESTTSSVIATGLAISAQDTAGGSNGGSIIIGAALNVNLDTATLTTHGDDVPTIGFGGHISVQSFNGSLSWATGTGDVRPVGTNVPSTNDGTIVLKYCTAITLGATFLTDGAADPGFPAVTNVCGGAPDLTKGGTITYVVLPSCIPCQECHPKLVIHKIVVGAVPGTDWSYTVSGATNGLIGTFTAPAAGGDSASIDLPVGAGTYTVTETTKPGYAVSPSNPQSVTVTATDCDTHTLTFTNTCHPKITITKVVTGATPATDWEYSSDIPGHLTFTIDKAGGSVTYDLPVGAGTYTVTETTKPGYAVSPSNPQSVTVTATDCDTHTLTFTNTCHPKITITKVVTGATPATDWIFTTDIPGVPGGTFTLPAAGGSVTFDLPLGAATYTVTETTKPGYAVTPSASQQAVVAANNCGTYSLTFTNKEVVCAWCNKGAVLSQVQQNMGDSCAIPDILVDLRQTAWTTVDITKLHTGKPATGSLQAAINFVNSALWPANDPTPGDGEIFIGVTVTDPVASDTCGVGCARPAGGDSPFGLENVVVTNTRTDRLNIFGCSVSIHPADPNQPVITIVNSTGGKGKITVLDLHVSGSNVAGYKITNTGDLVTVKNGRALNNTLYGYWVTSASTGKVEITGAPQISGNGIGIFVEGSNVTLRTNSDIIDNGTGIKITGNSNETNDNEVGTSGHPNGTGIIVSGKTNKLHDDAVNYNTGDGVVLSGSGTTLATGNNVTNEDSNSNGGNGFLVSGNFNTVIKNNQIKSNGGDGIKVTGNNNLIQENDVENNSGNGINVSGSTNTITKSVSKGNTLNGILVSGNSNTLSSNQTVESNKLKGFSITGSLNKLVSNQAKNNTGSEFTIAANNNSGSSGNKANGTSFTITAAGGSFE